MKHLNLSPIDVVDDISKEDFIKYYQKPLRPVVIKNFTKNWQAVNKWSYDYLKDKAGEEKVKLYGRWLDNDPTAIEMPPAKEMRFSDYLDMVEKGEESDLRIFLFNLFKLAPELLDDFNYPDIVDGWLKDYPYTFFGCAGSDVRLHYDIDLSHVFITQFGGTKRITLFDQDQTKFLYRLPFTTHSAVDFSNVDYEKYPALKFARGYQHNLEHGETLFMPSGIWHYIEYINGSFSLSLRSLSDSNLYRLKGAYNVFVIRKLDYFINKFYKNSWSDFKLKRAIAKAHEILDEREQERNEA
jgi:ribosomal protein L16 Arg81 hydroxylase